MLSLRTIRALRRAALWMKTNTAAHKSYKLLGARRRFGTTPDSDADFQPKVKVTGTPLTEEAKLELINKTIREGPVVLFMKGTPQQPACGFSNKVVRILNSYGVPIHGVNVLESPFFRNEMKTFSDWPFFPQLYVNAEFIGGCDVVTQLHEDGELKDILAPVTKLQ